MILVQVCLRKLLAKCYISLKSRKHELQEYVRKVFVLLRIMQKITEQKHYGYCTTTYNMALLAEE